LSKDTPQSRYREGVLAIGPRGGIAPVKGFAFETIDEARARRLAAKAARKARRCADKARSDAAREERIATMESRARGNKTYCACGAELKYGGTMCRACYIKQAAMNKAASYAADVAARREARIKKAEASYAADVAARREARIKKAEASYAAKVARAAAQAEARTKPKRCFEPQVRAPAPPRKEPPVPASVRVADPWVAIRARTYGKPPLVEGAIRPLTKFEMMTGRRERINTQ
jgi:hypothetical protein